MKRNGRFFLELKGAEVEEQWDKTCPGHLFGLLSQWSLGELAICHIVRGSCQKPY